MKHTTKLGLLGLLAGAGAGALGLNALGNYYYDMLLLPRSYSPQTHPAGEEDPILLGRQWLRECPGRRDLTLRAVDGLRLHAHMIPARDQASRRWVVCVHPYHDDSSAMGLYASHYRQMGYHVLIPDLRGFGQSEGDYVGMGWDDRLDLVAWVSALLRRHGDAQVVLHGVSMGAAAALMAAGGPVQDNVRAVISESSYTTALEVLRHVFQLYYGGPLPSAAAMAALRGVTRRRAGYDLRNADALKAVSRSQVPTLFIHGTRDQFAPPSMMADLYEKAACPHKQFLWVPEAGHGQCAAQQPELYWDTVDAFLRERLA